MGETTFFADMKRASEGVWELHVRQRLGGIIDVRREYSTAAGSMGEEYTCILLREVKEKTKIDRRDEVRQEARRAEGQAERWTNQKRRGKWLKRPIENKI